MKHIVLGYERDAHVRHVLDALARRGHDAVLLESQKFPLSVSVSVYPGRNAGSLGIDGKTIDFDQIASVYWRSFSGVTAETTKASRGTPTDIAYFDSMACLRSWFQMRNGTRWLNSWEAYQQHQEKPRQLELVAQAGVTIPDTYVGNDPQQVIAFCERVPSAIFKPVYGGAHTQQVTPQHLAPAHLQAALAQSPVTLQQFIAGTNVRTYAMGEQCFSVELPTTQVDFRADQSARPIPVATPDAVATQAAAIRKVLGLRWTAIDWRRDQDGAFYFLEANPSPMFIGVEKMAGVPLTDALIDLMTGAAQ